MRALGKRVSWLARLIARQTGIININNVSRAIGAVCLRGAHRGVTSNNSGRIENKMGIGGDNLCDNVKKIGDVSGRRIGGVVWRHERKGENENVEGRRRMEPSINALTSPNTHLALHLTALAHCALYLNALFAAKWRRALLAAPLANKHLALAPSYRAYRARIATRTLCAGSIITKNMASACQAASAAAASSIK